MTFNDIISKLNDLSDKDKISFKEKKFGVIANNSLGIYHKDLKEIAKEIGKDSQLGIQLFDTNIYEARLLCSKIYDPKELTEPLMEKWVRTFENWEICDSFCMGLFSRSVFVLPKIQEWTSREREFEKRAGFAMIASYCMADKKASNAVFESFFPLLRQEANDERLYVKKAVNWALRNIGKRNIDLHKKALEVAYKLLKTNSKSAQWVAKDAIKQLERDNVNILDYPRDFYRK